MPRVHFNNGFALRWISINRGRGSAPGKAAVQAQQQETFRRLISRRKNE